MFKRPQLPDGFEGRCSKGTVREGATGSVREGTAGCVISSCTVLGLIGIKVRFQESSTIQFFFFNIYFIFGCVRFQLRHGGSSLQHVGFSLVVAHGLSSCRARAPERMGSVVVACGLSRCGPCVQQLRHAGLVAPQHVGSQFPDQGLNLCPLHWGGRFLTTGPPGKSQPSSFNQSRVFVLVVSSFHLVRVRFL